MIGRLLFLIEKFFAIFRKNRERKVIRIKLEVLLSAMNLKNYKYIDSLNITGDCVVVNQCDKEDLQRIKDADTKFATSKQLIEV